MSKIKRIYALLLNEYGKQGWWPVTKTGNFHPTYDGGPISERQQFEVIAGAILTQNTSWKNVEKAIYKLNKENVLEIDKIKDIKNDKLAELIRSTGYYNQKSIKLKNMAELLDKYPIKKLEKLETKHLRELLLSAKGVGPETADSILLYAFQRSVFVVDAYTKRIFSRLGIIKKNDDYDKVQNFFMDNLEKDEKLFNEYHALIVEHAKRYCTKKSNCIVCPISRECNKQIE